MTEPAAVPPGFPAAVGAVVHTRPAGFISRALAALIDAVIVIAICAGIYLGSVFVRLLLAPARFSWPTLHFFLSATGFVIVSVVYLTFWWSTSGRTIGAAVLGIRVRSTRGHQVNWLVAFLRAIFCTIVPIGLFVVIFDPARRRSLQDIVLRTGVTYELIIRPGHAPILPGEDD